MAKATDNTQVGGMHTAYAQLTVPKSKALYDLLRGSGRVTGAAAEKVLNAIAVKADPGDHSVPVVTILGTPYVGGHPSEADAAVSGLALLLAKARAEGHEAADLVAGLAAQLGYREPVPEPPAPEPAPALQPAPAPAPGTVA